MCECKLIHFILLVNNNVDICVHTECCGLSTKKKRKPIRCDPIKILWFGSNTMSALILFSILIRFHPVFLSVRFRFIRLLINRSTKEIYLGDLLDPLSSSISSAICILHFFRTFSSDYHRFCYIFIIYDYHFTL